MYPAGSIQPGGRGGGGGGGRGAGKRRTSRRRIVVCSCFAQAEGARQRWQKELQRQEEREEERQDEESVLLAQALPFVPALLLRQLIPAADVDANVLANASNARSVSVGAWCTVAQTCVLPPYLVRQRACCTCSALTVAWPYRTEQGAEHTDMPALVCI